MIHTTVIIPSLHSPWIGQVLNALRSQAYDLTATEVLVVGLDRHGLVQEDELVRFISTTTPVPPAIARNLGLREARGEIICFLDADCVPSSDWLARLTAPYANPDIHVVGGAVTFLDNDFWTLCDTLAHFSNVISGAPADVQRHLPSLNLSARREVFERVGEFDERFPHPAGEDTELTKRMIRHGYTLWLANDAIVFHLARRANLVELWRRGYRHGQAVGVKSLRTLLQAESPFFQWPLMFVTSVPRALLVTLNIFWKYPTLRKYWAAFPVVFSIKLVWVLSAVLAIYQQSRRDAS